ncbi:MAG: glycosyltransferase [Candidatus Peregrinibacteria bacterium]
MAQPKVTVGVILFTGCEKYLHESLPSLMDQDYPNIEFLFRDQSPNGEVYNYLKENLPRVFEQANVKIQKGENKMHSGGHNALIGQMTGDYYVCASNDMSYPADFVSKVVAELEKPENQTYGSATVKLMQWDFEKGLKTNQLDSCGIAIKRTHHFFDLGQGEEDKGQYDSLHSIFGGSGALVVLRKKALEDIRYQNEYFDELIHYKNDVDLAYRLQWAGHASCLFLSDIRVWHDRQVGGNKGIIGSRSDKKRWAKEDSLFGHLVTLRKNFDRRFSLRTQLSTWLYNTAKFFYVLFREPHLLKQYLRVRRHRDEIRAKRQAMKRIAKPSDIESFMS